MCIRAVLMSIGILSCMYSFSKEHEGNPLLFDEKVSMDAFFSGFIKAVNSKEIELVKKMSGKSWPHWSKLINKGRLESVEILDIVADRQTNVVAKCVATDARRRCYPAEVVFTMRKEDGVYSIEAIRFPNHERQQREFDKAHEDVEQLVVAMNNRDLCAVKGLVSFGDVADFESELSTRGLSWVKSAIDAGTEIPIAGSGVSRAGNDNLIGRIYVPCANGGTNVLRTIVFKNGKIDRAAPREESLDEIQKRYEEEKTEEQRQSEKRMQEEYNRMLLKRMREIE